jgi:hypothetical protein
MKIYLRVPDYRLEKCKSLGLAFDPAVGQWYADSSDFPDEFGNLEILDLKSKKKVVPILGQTFIDVPFADNAKVKSFGAKFDGTVKSWYVIGKMPSELDCYDVWYPHFGQKKPSISKKETLKTYRSIMAFLPS